MRRVRRPVLILGDWVMVGWAAAVVAGIGWMLAGDYGARGAVAAVFVALALPFAERSLSWWWEQRTVRTAELAAVSASAPLDLRILDQWRPLLAEEASGLSHARNSVLSHPDLRSDSRLPQIRFSVALGAKRFAVEEVPTSTVQSEFQRFLDSAEINAVLRMAIGDSRPFKWLPYDGDPPLRLEATLVDAKKRGRPILGWARLNFPQTTVTGGEFGQKTMQLTICLIVSGVRPSMFPISLRAWRSFVESALRIPMALAVLAEALDVPTHNSPVPAFDLSIESVESLNEFVDVGKIKPRSGASTSPWFSQSLVAQSGAKTSPWASYSLVRLMCDSGLKLVDYESALGEPPPERGVTAESGHRRRRRLVLAISAVLLAAAAALFWRGAAERDPFYPAGSVVALGEGFSVSVLSPPSCASAGTGGRDYPYCDVLLRFQNNSGVTGGREGGIGLGSFGSIGPDGPNYLRPDFPDGRYPYGFAIALVEGRNFYDCRDARASAGPIYPGESRDVAVTFEVPVGVEPTEVQISALLGDGVKRIAIAVP